MKEGGLERERHRCQKSFLDEDGAGAPIREEVRISICKRCAWALAGVCISYNSGVMETGMGMQRWLGAEIGNLTRACPPFIRISYRRVGEVQEGLCMEDGGHLDLGSRVHLDQCL